MPETPTNTRDIPVYNDGLPEYTPEDFLPKQSSVEIITPETDTSFEPSNPAEAQELNELVKNRTEQAITDCEFERTPEVIHAIEGYYHDHYYLAGVINAVTEGRYDSPLVTAILEDPSVKPWEKEQAERGVHWGHDRTVSPNALTAAYKIARMVEVINKEDALVDENERMIRNEAILVQCAQDLLGNLFQESAVGASTMGSVEVASLKALYESLYAASTANYALSRNRSLSDELLPEERIESTKQRFWDDTRHAGQLEFHGSEDLDGIDADGLMSRNMQVRTKGYMRAAMLTHLGAGDENDHMHSVVPHFAEQYQEGGYTGWGERGGTLAIPLVKIIRTAPFARDAEYAVVKPLSQDAGARVAVPTMEFPVGSSGAGKQDSPGNRGLDRVFFASNDETSGKLPDEFIVSMHDEVEKPATYIIDRKIPQYTDAREHTRLRSGSGSAERITIDEDDDTAEKIRQLQQQYLSAYARYGVVIPLRRGVFAQSFENMAESRGRSGATIYNKYTPGSEKYT